MKRQNNIFNKIYSLCRYYGIKKLFVSLIKEIYRKLWKEKILESYSQNYEDLIVEKIFRKKYIGKYLEIGAYHPRRLSNTYRFYKKGWRGLVVEPNPEIKDLFNRLRPRDKFLGIGISDKNKKLNYYRFLIPALNTFSKENADQSVKEGHKMIGVEKIKTRNIREIVKNKIDFLSLDTEGFDEKILNNWPWNICKPKVICVEKNGQKMFDLMLKNKYFCYMETKYNLIFTTSK